VGQCKVLPRTGLPSTSLGGCQNQNIIRHVTHHMGCRWYAVEHLNSAEQQPKTQSKWLERSATESGRERTSAERVLCRFHWVKRTARSNCRRDEQRQKGNNVRGSVRVRGFGENTTDDVVSRADEYSRRAYDISTKRSAGRETYSNLNGTMGKLNCLVLLTTTHLYTWHPSITLKGNLKRILTTLKEVNLKRGRT
jgi:hypothetical protein